MYVRVHLYVNVCLLELICAIVRMLECGSERREYTNVCVCTSVCVYVCLCTCMCNCVCFKTVQCPLNTIEIWRGKSQ
jgi:hypothetical protein